MFLRMINLDIYAIAWENTGVAVCNYSRGSWLKWFPNSCIRCNDNSA